MLGAYFQLNFHTCYWNIKQGRIHGNTVADSWAGAVMQKLLAIQKYLLRTDRPTDRPTRQGGVPGPRLKTRTTLIVANG